MNMKNLKESEIFLIQQGLEALAENFMNTSKIYEEVSDYSEQNVRILTKMAQECKDLSIKISNFNKEESE